MFSFLEHEVSVWDRLKSANLPIMIYGMGDGADKIMRELVKRELHATEIFASDEFVRGHSFRGYKVRRFSEICEMYEKFIILVAFGVHDEPTMERLYQMSRNYELYAPDVPVVGDAAFDHAFLKAHCDEFSRAYELMADEQSRRVFKLSLQYKITGKIELLKQMESTPDEVYKTLLCVSQNEVYVDLGAYDGDTIRELLSYTDGKYKKIIALEPDRRNFKKLTTRTQGVVCINAGAWSEDCIMNFSVRGGRNSSLSNEGEQITMRSVDSVALDENVTYLKFDVEGAEYEALLGAKNTIGKCQPKLLVAAYHRNEDLYRLPILISELCPEHKIYLRHYPYIPAWETNLIAK